MKIKILLLLIATLLIGCETTTEKGDKADVIDQGTELSETATDTDAGATAHGTEEEGRLGMSVLEDPTHATSVRVIYFEYDSSDIRPEYRQTIEAHAALLAANPSTTITLEGHADERGSREYNLALGERRAQSVKRQMTLLGASTNQIRTVSYGEERPAIEGHDETAWGENRRVEIVY